MLYDLLTGQIVMSPGASLNNMLCIELQARRQEMKWGGVFFVKSGKWGVFCKKKLKMGGYKSGKCFFM